MKKSKLVFTAVATILVLTLSPMSAVLGSTAFVPLGIGTSFTYNSIPFEEKGILLEVKKTSFEFTPTQTIDLSGYTTDKIHIIESAGYADNVPDGVMVGHINVYYTDGSSVTMDQVVGVNIAEWAYDRLDLQPYLQHSKILLAYSWWVTQDSGDGYWGHRFYALIDTEEKPLNYLELVLDPMSYTNQQYHGYSQADWFGSAITALTLEVLESREVDIDIKPGSFPNSINLGSNGNGVIPVAILGSEAFNVHDIDPATIELEGSSVRLKGKNQKAGSISDVNSDGYDDLAVHIEDFYVITGATEATLTAALWDGTSITGTDSINIVPAE